MKPIIGIVEWPYTDKDGDYIYEVLTPIVEWIVRSGGRPIGLFPSNIARFVDNKVSEIPLLTEMEQQELKESISLCNAIVKPGATRIYNHERKIYEYCYEQDIPYLGICAGMQMMASYNNQIVNEKNCSNIVHNSKETYCHKVLIQELTLLKQILSKDEIMVNSRHNYHITGSGNYKVGAYAEDGIIEAIESQICKFHLGLQWHPELLPKEDENSQKIFGELIESAKQYQKRK